MDVSTEGTGARVLGPHIPPSWVPSGLVSTQENGGRSGKCLNLEQSANLGLICPEPSWCAGRFPILLADTNEDAGNSHKAGKIPQPDLKSGPQGAPACLQMHKGAVHHQHPASAKTIINTLLPGGQSAGIWLCVAPNTLSAAFLRL